MIRDRALVGGIFGGFFKFLTYFLQKLRILKQVHSGQSHNLGGMQHTFMADGHGTCGYDAPGMARRTGCPAGQYLTC